MSAISNTFVDGTTAPITDTNPVTVITSSGTGKKIYVTSILATNSNAGADTQVIIKAGTKVLAQGAAVAGGGFSIPTPQDSPRVGDADEDITAECDTMGADVVVTISGYEGL